jgi:hypothetical protein
MEVFSYPYGDMGSDPQQVEKLLRRNGYRAACLYGGELQTLPLADVYRCHRVAMGPDTNMEEELR